MDRVGQHLAPARINGEHHTRSAMMDFPAPASSRGVVPRIVAYGDSLTAGFPSCFSYAQYLSEALAEAGHPIEIHACGMCGMTAEQMVNGVNETALPDKIGRAGVGLSYLVRERHRGDKLWRAADLALIMTGTNDLAGPTQGEVIAGYIKELHEACHAVGVRTVALSIPDAGVRKFKRQRTSGRVLNERDIQKEVQLERQHQEEQRFKATRRRKANKIVADWARGRGGAAPAAPEQPTDKPVASLEAYLKALDMEEGGKGDEGEAVPSLEACLAQIDADGAREPLERPELFISMGSIMPHGPKAVSEGYWESDAVHFTKEGSRAIGRRLALLLQPLIQRLSAARLLGHGGEEFTAGGDDAAPSLEAFMEAFRLEDELASDSVAMSGKAQLVEEEQSAEPREWEEEAALKIQEFIRARQRRRHH